MTLEAQYKKYLKENSLSTLTFDLWKDYNSHNIKQALVNMMKDDEELGLYDEPKPFKDMLSTNKDEWNEFTHSPFPSKKQPFKHKVETIPAEEILANRSNAYEFIDFDKQETLHEVALEFAKDHHEMYETSNLGSMHFGFIEGVKWQQQQDKNKYNEEEAIDIAKQAFVLGKDFGLIGTFNEWFETVKKK